MKNLKLSLMEELKHPHLSAGSGMVWYEDEMFVVADDELSLFSYPLDFENEGKTYKLFPGELPEDPKERKKLKPDIESLFLDGSTLYCIPSGSKKRRTRAVSFHLPTHQSQIIDCHKLYEKLEDFLPELNIEGSVLRGSELYLFQRGNGRKNQNAVIVLDFKNFPKTSSIKKIYPVELGHLDDIHLSFTDVAMAEGVIYFTAAAENTSDTYLDGEVVGSILGILDENFQVRESWRLPLRGKPEGLWIAGKHFYLVTDDDDPERPSRLYKGELPR